MPPVSVLHLIHNLELGGAQGVIRQLVAQTDRARVAPEVVSLFDPLGTVVEKELAEAGVPVHFLDKHPGLDLHTFRRLDRLLAARRPDVMHSHCYGLTYAFPVAWRRRIPVHVHTMHTLAETEVTSRLQHWVYRRAFRSGVVPVAVIEEVRASLHRVYGLDDVPFIPNGVSIDRFQDPVPDRAAWRAAEGFGADDLLFVCVARLNYPKNQQGLIEAFAEAALPDAYLLLVGDGPDREALEAEAARRGVTGRVRFLGARTDVPAILGAADVFVLFSTYEGNPLAVMEAMAAGCAVLASDVGGIPDLLDAGAAGVLVASDDRTALADALRRLAEDERARSEYGRMAARRARERFSARAMADAYAALYERLLGSNRSKKQTASGSVARPYPMAS